MKSTRKHNTAKEIAIEEGLTDWPTRKMLYKAIVGLGYTWNMKQGEWLFLPDMQAKATVKIRVLAELNMVDAIASEIVDSFPNLTMIERSKVYEFIPKLEGRVYLTFAPKIDPLT